MAQTSIEVASSLTLVRDTPEETLCSSCSKLGLNAESFVVNTASATVDIVGEPHDAYELRKAHGQFRLKSGTKQDFSTLRDVEENRTSCPFCSLVCRAVERYSGEGRASREGKAAKVDGSTVLSVCWEVHGRRAEGRSHFVNKTRRIRLSWDELTGRTQVVFLLCVAPREAQQPNSDAASYLNRQMHFFGRELGSDQKEKQALIKSWLDICTREHKGRCNWRHTADNDHDDHGHDAFRALVDETYFSVIDVVDMQLKSLPLDRHKKPEPFVALSYVWGSRQAGDTPYVTNQVNVMTRILHGGLETAWDSLPRTLQDAILLVSRLGYRYLWIDSLCIVQDSPSSWKLNAQAMHLVYGNALFTICAADGQDASVGLLAAQGSLRLSAGANPLDDSRTHPISENVANGVRLMVTRPLEVTVDDSAWNHRAWTFQERVLSRRCLIFAEGRVHFQCCTATFSQDIYVDGKANKEFSLDHAMSPLRTLSELGRRPICFYQTYVRMYTGRKLTKPEDVMAAFQGIERLLGRYMYAPFVFGMPVSHFDFALLWSPLAAIRRRKPRDGFGIGTLLSADMPTWSWYGWMDGRIEYNAAMLDGCLTNVQEWLTKHTWIQWHIRDERGHLVALCKANMPPPMGMRNTTPGRARADERWMGYPGLEMPIFDDSESYYERLRPTSYPRRRHERRNYRSPRDDGPMVVRHRDVDSTSYDDIFLVPEREKNSWRWLIWRAVFFVLSFLKALFSRPRRLLSQRTLPPSRRLPHQVRIKPEKNWTRASNRQYRERRSSPPPATNSTSSVSSYFSDDQSSLSLRRPSPPSSRRPAHYGRSNREERWVRASNRKYRERKTTRMLMTSSTSSSSSSSSTSSSSDADGFAPDSDDSNDDDEYQDDCGRCIRASEIPHRLHQEAFKFTGILPGNAFGVIRDLSRGSYRPWSETTWMAEQYMPILQFFTWRTDLHVVVRSADSTSTVGPANEGLCQCDILDKAGDWCGAIVLNESWIRKWKDYIFRFIAISDAKAFTVEECPVWTYYIPKERDESEWDVYYVLLLERNVERSLWERVGLGKVFKAAFRDKTWAEIKLG